MKHLLTIITLITLFNSSFAQQFSNANEYMSYIGEKYDLISKDTWAYTKAAAHSKGASKVEKKRLELLKSTLSAKANIHRMPAYKGDITYRDAVVKYLELSYIMLKEDYEKIMDLEEIAEQSYDLMEAYLLAKEKANEKYNEASKMLADAQKSFAASNNITLIDKETKISKNLEISNKVIKYYNIVYLIFFKSYNQESYLIEALGKGDISAIEQNKNSLEEFSKEGLEKLKKVFPYDKDPSLKNACYQMLNFYKSETGTKMDAIVDFYLKKENYEKIKTAFDAKKQSAKTQEDVNQFNDAVNDYNASIASYNQANDALNTERNNLLDTWNKTTKRFMDKHVP